jgi:hypothetical protein
MQGIAAIGLANTGRWGFINATTGIRRIVMTTSSQLFADRIVNLSITGPLIRIELGVIQLTEGSEKPTGFVATQTLVMPLDGFANSFRMLEQAMKKLAESGLVKVNPAAQSPPPAG